jgi:hypothetical protein
VPNYHHVNVVLADHLGQHSPQRSLSDHDFVGNAVEFRRGQHFREASIGVIGKRAR